MKSLIKKYIAILTLFFWVMPLTFAWNALGHKLIAEIAYQQLTPDARGQVDALLNHQFVKASVWADQVRAQGDDAMNTWHYINLPKPGPQKNVVDAIKDSHLILMDSKASQREKQQALRGLIHWVGDIHQPLHTIGRDRGGTLFVLAKNPDGKNLHQLWDNGAGACKTISGIKATAQAWRQAYPPNPALLKETDPMQWAQEGYLLATSQAYVGVKPNSMPNSAYLKQSQQIVHQQIVLAGTRLAQLLNRIYSFSNLKSVDIIKKGE